MYTKLPGRLLPIFFKGIPLVLVIVGSILLLSFHYFLSGESMPIEAGVVSEMVKIPLDFMDLGIYKYVLETENYLLFQSFESLPPESFPQLTLAFGIAMGLLMGIGLSLVSLFKRMQFVLSMVLIIFLLTLTGVNGLNIGGLNTNLAMILLMTGFVLPAVIIHTFYDHWSIVRRTMVILPIALFTLPLLVYLGEVPSGELLISENISVLGLAISAIFMIYNGHAVISSVFVFLVKINKGIGLKISWHLTAIFLIYLLFCLFLLLKITGNVLPEIPIPPIMILLLLVGILGYFETKRKIEQIAQPYSHAFVGEGLYLIGFAVTVLVFWKAEFSVNRPMMDFIHHVFVYSQLAFGLLFYAYLMSNFSGLMNQGQNVEKILFQPKFFAYYHMRIGALLAMLSLVVFADGIVGVQLSTASTNATADYYYEVNRLREAGILYENSWERYRRNEKAINAVAHLALAQNQPTAAINTLVRGFENTPSVNDLLLLSSSLQKSGKSVEALNILEKGLSYFPENPYLLNNIALLYSRSNRGEQAYQLLDRMENEAEVAIANKIGFQAKHLIRYDDAFPIEGNRFAQVNQLALDNKKGDTSSFSVQYEQIQEAGSVLNRAVLRNQWSNRSGGDISKDFALIDSLLAHNFDPEVEEELRETRVIRSYNQNYINEALKHINGLAYQFTNSAGFFHSMAANILIGQLDFEKAAIELGQAESRGFKNFKPQHLPLLFFGGQPQKAFEISGKYSVSFPEWMDFDGDEQLIANDTTVFFTHLSSLHISVKKDFMEGLEEIKPIAFKRYFAYQILLRKGHWLEKDEIARLVILIGKSPQTEIKDVFFEELTETLTKGISSNEALREGGILLSHEHSLQRNAYWTPLVLMAMEQSKDNLEKYNILLEASDFNKDPLLWINLVKYSRLIGVDNYASSVLREMSAWVDPKILEELQLQVL